MDNFEQIINDLSRRVKKFDKNLNFSVNNSNDKINFYFIGGGLALILFLIIIFTQKKQKSNFKLKFNCVF